MFDAAKKELDLKFSYSFDYEPVHGSKRKKESWKDVDAVKLIPIHQPEHEDRLLEERDRLRSLDLAKALLLHDRHFFLSLGFTEEELKKEHCSLIVDMERARRQGKILITLVFAEYAGTKKNPKTYAVKAERKKITIC